MKIESTPRGFQVINFNDDDDNPCVLQQSGQNPDTILLGLNDARMRLSKEQLIDLVKFLLCWLKLRSIRPTTHQPRARSGTGGAMIPMTIQRAKAFHWGNYQIQVYINVKSMADTSWLETTAQIHKLVDDLPAPQTIEQTAKDMLRYAIAEVRVTTMSGHSIHIKRD